MKTRYYIALTLYNYDLTSRYDRQKIYFNDEAKARNEYVSLMQAYRHWDCHVIQERTGEWLKKHRFDDAWVESVEGIFKETTEKLV